MLMTQEKVDVNSMQTLCGRYASHVQIIAGTPISLISDRERRGLNDKRRASTRVSSTRTRCTFCRTPTGGFALAGFRCSDQQKQAWIRLMVNALETNFFFYQSTTSVFSRTHRRRR